MKILSLRSENVKRLHVVEITPDGNLVIIGGGNGNGKTSVLDSLAIALGAKLPKEPVRRGAESADITVKLSGGFLLRRHVTNAGSSLVLTGDGGKTISSPQVLLDTWTSTYTYDPLEFQRKKPKEQAATLQKIVGLDFTAMEAERAALYDERTAVNRELKSAKATADNAVSYIEAPAVEQSVAGLAEELAAVAGRNAQKQKERDAVDRLKDKGLSARAHYERATTAVARLKEELIKAEDEANIARAALNDARSAYDTQKACAASLVDEPMEAIINLMDSIESLNVKIRANLTKRTWIQQAEQKKEEVDALTDQIDALDKSRDKQLAEAKFPVPGLSFSAEGVQFRGLPFEQASRAEQLRVSAAIGIAMNKELRVMMIRDGSLLDADNLQMLAEMAEESSTQIWLEKVSQGEECQVVICDGRVKGAE